MRYKVLGPFEVRRDGEDLTPSAPRLREVLALLVVRHNHVVTMRELVDELWGADPPTTAVSTLQTYVYRLRRLFSGRRPTRSEGVLRTKGDGYALEIPPEQVDLHHFTGLAGQGRAALNEGDAERASRLCAMALDLWEGETALGGVAAGDLLAAQITRLEEMRLRVLELRIEADLLRGEHGELVGELKGLTMTHPLHEAFHGQLMLALHRANRRGEALSTYRRLRELMITELGLEPSAKLRELQQALLAADPSIEAAPKRPSGAVAVRLPGPPAQLPPDIADFVGRSEQLRTAERLLAGDDERAPTIPVLSVTGMPGVGKTTLAVRIAHHARSSYPDGQLHADLGGCRARPADPADVLARFLRALGLGDDQVPTCLDERTTLFRTWTADRRVLMVLDDAASAQQVQPLLPGGERCGVLITSRRRFSGFAAAHQLEVPPLTGDEAYELFGRLVGQAQVAAEPVAARRVVALCGHLPLAVRGVAARLLACGPTSLDALRLRLEAEHGRFEELRFGEFDVGARLLAELRSVEPEVRTALAGLASLEASTFTSRQTLDAPGWDDSNHRRLLARLVECNLLRMTGHDSPVEARYSLHPLIRLFAREELSGQRTSVPIPALPDSHLDHELNGVQVDLSRWL